MSLGGPSRWGASPIEPGEEQILSCEHLHIEQVNLPAPAPTKPAS